MTAEYNAILPPRGRSGMERTMKEYLDKVPELQMNAEDQQSLPLRETVYLSLRKWILTGQLAPGERLTEIRLGKLMGTSRTPIREAIRKLELEGLVTLTPGSGARVAKFTEEELRDILEVRSSLEMLSASLASQRISEEEKEELKNCCRNFRKTCASGDIMQIVEADIEFHDVILRAARNIKLIEMTSRLADNMYRYRYEYVREKNAYERLIEEHERICDAIISGDPERASEEEKIHIINQQTAVLSEMHREKEEKKKKHV